jgi:4-amino-4-deoxy-L-arabinose transferase-like glycosyltransferase
LSRRQGPRDRPETWARAALTVLVAGALYVHLQGLGHVFIAPWDEAVHAVVAAHLTQHPLLPTLYETAALSPADLADWQHAHIWIHLPPLGLQAAALSMRIFGLGTFQLRLPGVVFASVGMLATYGIGRRLGGMACGLVAAAIAGYAPYALLVAQGYVFGDLTDTPLLALAPITVLLMLRQRVTGRLRWAVAAGAAQGLGILAKGPFSLATSAVVMALVLLDVSDDRLPDERPLDRLLALGCFAVAAALTALPYYIYLTHAFPASYAVESGNWIRAFFHNYEGWGRPWDFHLTEYLYALYGSPLAALVIGGTLLTAFLAVTRRRPIDVVAATWALATYIPITLAVSKADPFALPATPAVALVVGRVAQLAINRDAGLARDLALALLAGAGAAAVLHLVGVAPFADVARDHQYQTFTPLHDLIRNTFAERLVPLQLDLYLSAAVLALTLVVRRAGRPRRWASTAVVAVTCAALAMFWLRLDLQVAQRPLRAYDTAPIQGLGRLVAEHTPANATVALREGLLPMAHSDLMIMFWSGRDVYETGALAPDVACELQLRSLRSNSPLYYLTPDPSAGQRMAETSGWALYRVSCGNA